MTKHKTKKKVCIMTTHRIVCDFKKKVPFIPQRLGISISSPPSGGPVPNPVDPSGVVVNGGNPCQATVTVWLTDPWGNKTYGSVTGPDANGNWSATFPNVATENYTLTAQAQMDSQTATQSISIIVE